MTTQQLLEFKEIIRSKSESDQRKPDKDTRKLLFYLFTSTRGGFTRLRIIMLLLENPLNTHQLSQDLDLDYKAVQHHMKVLEKNNMVQKIGDKYGAIYHLSTFLEVNIRALDEAIDKLDRKMNHKKVYI
ncbi:MAG: winged helix-turn-helix transcriptional regulator [Nitrosopumilaceae archaeon]|jgi:DNA-binding transcriptional ArsR family regulator|uniref:Winged helix-turn-helix transcriptional regulator n=3 Tax=Candidatus Nitrosomaritimum aestuariumsis TaxID=3342354 RepID=A0AC60WAL7_9ARCH|nr:winged helix-turn-helix transcriptional regulator [Nitrosopumilaceae archaeon]MBA4454439.1 winged helix-turn-helix transcriptional regulator [Nitrosopumilaceae archaeon]MBA4460668.1 winged helix-turn-helix transcriptional regulator [Nitrosopumilaceae archaeon]MBA4460932.1 winged helix-turn-helix transcriptional regulator [Nitrosopumilaceae archaeon]MBA4464161.1 winged helix-turn-helix transcriptional regulator [Nitrosopumilaceae archaeon]